MKNPDRNTVSRLEELPNIGKSIAADLRLIGIDNPSMLAGRGPFELYDQLCCKAGKKIDPCVIDVFMSAINFMETGKVLPWWDFTTSRKNKLKAKE